MKLTARNPFKKSDLINYEADSEDEWNDLEGEDVDDDGEEDEDDSDDSGCIRDGWIVDDDEVLSDTSQEDSDFEGRSIVKTLSKRKQEMGMKRENRRRLEERRNALLKARAGARIEIVDGRD